MFIATAPAFAQQAGRMDYPKRPVNVLIGFAPGGGSDVMLSMVRPLWEARRLFSPIRFSAPYDKIPFN